ncbi:MAG: serpin family protein [Candidatus ainarchaeum sp.]|nr:serpin family protein [Candidatus ainarchaeum sp.]
MGRTQKNAQTTTQLTQLVVEFDINLAPEVRRQQANAQLNEALAKLGHSTAGVWYGISAKQGDYLAFSVPPKPGSFEALTGASPIALYNTSAKTPNEKCIKQLLLKSVDKDTLEITVFYPPGGDPPDVATFYFDPAKRYVEVHPATDPKNQTTYDFGKKFDETPSRTAAVAMNPGESFGLLSSLASSDNPIIMPGLGEIVKYFGEGKPPVPIEEGAFVNGFGQFHLPTQIPGVPTYENAADANAAIESKTNGAVKNFLSSSAASGLFSFCFFKGDWAEPFDVLKTAAGKFLTAQNKSVDAQFMNDTRPVLYLVSDVAKIVRLDYKDGKSMYFVLPNQNEFNGKTASAEEVLSYLKDKWASIVTSIKSDFVHLSIPKLDISYKPGKEQLKAAIEYLYPGKSGKIMSDVDFLSINNLKIDEKGTEASGASAGLPRGMVESVVFNRPYFAILADENGILLVTYITNPVQNKK